MKKHYFLIGIGGVGMQGLAELLQSQGHMVSGSDMKAFDAFDQMMHKGIKVTIGHDVKNIENDVDEVIISAAIPEANPEIQEAKKRKLPIRRRLELVGEIMESKTGIAISGTHGKTTTTKMITMILQAAGRHPTSLIGAEVKNLSANVLIGNGPEMVVEGCEYSRSFLDLKPKIAVITNIEADHLDYYKDLDEIKEAFKTFAKSVPKKGGAIIANGDDENVRDILKDIDTKKIFVGFNEGNDVRATNLEFKEGRLYFSINGERLHLQIPGRHNVADAMLAWGLARHLGIDDSTIKHVLQDEFKGVERRFQLLGTVNGVTFMDDYAHHPTEIKATLEGMREYFGDRRLVVVFHPHQFSRTRLLLDGFATSFQLADLVVVAPIYAVRDSEKDKKSISAEVLVEAINQANEGRVLAKFVGDFEAIKKFIVSELKSGDVLITLGAGEANLCGEDLLNYLRDK
jgi:UDP-N-acetylmuramate--alanine ligase